jgi:5-methyltetrahydrofolate--homocysteine methyltransferase
VTDVPLCIDSSIVKALESGLAAYQGKPLLNSVTGEDERLDVVLPLVAQYKCAVIGISNDETGISEDPAVRFAVAKKIIERAESYGIPREDVLIDPLAMPIGALGQAGKALFTTVRRCGGVGGELPLRRVHISFGLPDRPA